MYACIAVTEGRNEASLLEPNDTHEDSSRVAYLEKENARLHRMVAELLIKNEQLRQQTRVDRSDA